MPTIKRVYHVETVPQALALAKRELGDEALLLSARAVRPEQRHLGKYEVAVAVEASPAPAAPPRQARLTRTLADVKAGLLQVSSALACPSPADGGNGLAGLELPQETVDRWYEIAGEERGSGGAPGMEELKTAFHRLVRCESHLHCGADRPAIVAVAGPPGTGKTSLLAKLAFRYGLQEGRDAAFVSTDTQRIAAGEALRAYAAILGVPVAFAETLWGLEKAFREFGKKDLILVDTPGCGPKDLESFELWARCFAGFENLEIHLVLNAQARSADQLSAVDRWAAFRPARLAFAHVDEAGCTAGMVAAAARSGLPVSFFGIGQAVPEDIEEATPKRMLAGLFGRQDRARAAAR